VNIFQKTGCPPSEISNPINETAVWFTWSSQARDFLRQWAEEVEGLEEPKLTFISADRPYNYTFSLSARLIKKKNLLHQLDSFARALMNIKLSHGIMLLTGIFNGDFDGRALHFLFSCLRDRLVTTEQNSLAALYPPLGLTNEGSASPVTVDFPLHCDLYAPKLLFNVFEDVPSDDSGASLFLSVIDLQTIMDKIPSLPTGNRSRILACINSSDGEDHYDEFFDLVHGIDHEYTLELEKEMFARQKRIKLYPGQGYLIHERLWLHGREAPSNGVAENRLYRFVFDSFETRSHTTNDNS